MEPEEACPAEARHRAAEEPHTAEARHTVAEAPHTMGVAQPKRAEARAGLQAPRVSQRSLEPLLRVEGPRPQPRRHQPLLSGRLRTSRRNVRFLTEHRNCRRMP